VQKKVKVAQFGLGPIAIESVKPAEEKNWIRVVGGIDIDTAKVGSNIGELPGISKLGGAKVYGTFEKLAEKNKPDVVLQQIKPMAEGATTPKASRRPRPRRQSVAVCTARRGRSHPSEADP